MPIPSADEASWLAAYKAYRGITQTGDDTQTTNFLKQVVAKAERWCGKPLVMTTVTSVTEVLSGHGTDTVVLSNTPVAAITSVSLIDDSGSSTALSSTEYRCNLTTGVLRRVGASSALEVFDDPQYVRFGESPSFPKGFRNVSVVYTYGVASFATIPDDIKLAVFNATDRARAMVGKRDTEGRETLASEGEYFRALFAPFANQVAA